jgi:hypothetical protein
MDGRVYRVADFAENAGIITGKSRTYAPGSRIVGAVVDRQWDDT